MATHYEQILENVRSKLLLMGQLSIDSLRLSLQALIDKDAELAGKVRSKDKEIDMLENELVNDVNVCLSTHAPVAGDLRLLVTTMKISHEIERVGDEAKSIARRSKKILVNDFHMIPKMAEAAQDMLREALSVFVEYDEKKAKSIWTKDLEIDAMNLENNQFCQALVIKDTHLVSSIFELLFISKSLERIADHAVNISKDAVFLATSRDIRHAPEFKKSFLKKNLD
jgi:phosphate transport system protein